MATLYLVLYHIDRKEREKGTQGLVLRQRRRSCRKGSWLFVYDFSDVNLY